MGARLPLSHFLLRSASAAIFALVSGWGPDELRGDSGRWSAGAQIGATSSLADCRPERGCASTGESYPLLYIQAISARALIVGLAAEDVGPEPAGTVRILAGHAGEPGLQQEIERLGHSRTVVGFDDEDKPLTEYRLHVLLRRPLISGQRYRVEFTGEEEMRVSFSQPDDPVSPSIQVNQAGYLPRSPKSAFIGNWLGTAGPMPVDAREFEVIDTVSGRSIHTGALTPVATPDTWSGNNVYRADFNGLNSPGEYRLRVEGIGRSVAFKISKEVFEPVYRRAFRLFYHVRNSTAITTPWADPGQERPGGTPLEYNALIHPAVGSSPLGRGEKPYSYRAIRRGWFDAGDFGQYVVNAAPAWYAFGTGFDLSPASFAGDDLGIPESGNGVPDVIDELEWGMDWLLSMQDPLDGGVYSRVAPLRWDESLPHAVDRPRFLFEKTTHASASFAAAAAIHARLIGPWRPERSRTVLEAAKAAWEFVESSKQWPPEGSRYRNPPGVHAGEYPDESAVDNRMWAAAELFRSTGEERYLRAYLSLSAKDRPDPTAGVTFRKQGMAARWAMYQATQESTRVMADTAELRRGLKDLLLSAADWRLRKAAEHPFDAPMHQHKAYTGWGSFAHSSRAVIPLLQAWSISGNAVYRDSAAAMTNPQLGANPQSISYITGIGSDSVAYPLSKLDQYRPGGHKAVGIPVNGPHYHLPALWPSTRAVNNSYLPPEDAGEADGYPVLRRYVDARPLPPMAEPTVAEYATTAVAFGLLSDEDLLFRGGR